MRNILFLMLLLSGATLSAQHIGYLIPAGGQPGHEAEILIGGQQLWGIKTARITGTGVTVESVTPVPGMPNISGKQQKFVTAWMRNIVNGKNEIPARPTDEEELKNWRKHPYYDRMDQLTPLQFHLLTIKMFVPRNPLQMSPAINQNVIVKLKIAPDAEPGRRELRLVRNNQSVSNPLPFYVDSLPIVLEPYLPVPPQKRKKYEFTLPAVLNGQIMPGETDLWHFSARKGEKIVFQAFARSMIPFMGDCVPGYFQCVLELRDSRGRSIAYADDHGFDPDPLLCCTIQENGEYTLCVRDALYRGRADFVYRIRAYQGNPPEFRLKAPELALTRKHQRELARDGRTDFPVLLEGCIDRPGRTDRFVIRAQKGESIVGEVFARRLGSRLDSRLTVIGPDGKQTAFNDDFPRILAGTVMQHTDSFLCFKAPADGDYTFLLTDTAGLGGPNHGYFLRIDHLKPSFNLYVSPSAKPVAIGTATPLKIRVEPLEDFTGDIKLHLKAPNQYSIIGSDVIPAGTKETTITITCQDRKRQPVRAELVAEHEIKLNSCCPCCNPRIRGKVFYGDEDTQAFAYTHLILSEEWLLSKIGSPYGAYYVAHADPKQTRLTIRSGGTARLKLRRRKMPPKTELKFALRNAPAGLTLVKTEVQEQKNGWADITLTLKADKSAAGKDSGLREPDAFPRRFNQSVTGIFSYETRPNKEGKVFRRTNEFVLPALLYEITKD